MTDLIHDGEVDDAATEALARREGVLVPIKDLIYDPGAHRCGRCGRQTHYLDLGFEIPLCAYPCYGLMWAEYWQALRR